MTSTIIIDFHAAQCGRDALALARSLGEFTGARLVTVTSYMRDRYGMLPVQGWHWAMREETKAAAELARSLMADEPGGIARVIGATSPARALQETAEREQADLIVLSSVAGVEPGRVHIGASGRQALQGAPCAVALAPAGFADSDRSLAPVGVGFDGSAEAHLALTSAMGVAEAVGGELRVISVLGQPAPAHPMFAFSSYQAHIDQLRDAAQARLEDVFEAVPTRAEVDPVVVEGEPADILLKESDELGLLVVGSRAYGPLRRVLLGSVSDVLLDGAACPVLVLPRGVQRPFAAPVLHTRPASSH
jgi:nucleotide-binding universal stress UspA family protein